MWLEISPLEWVQHLKQSLNDDEMRIIGLGLPCSMIRVRFLLTDSKPADPLFAVEVGGAFAAQHGLLLATDTGCAVLF
ncbi:hypothetical protein NC653_021673 [Populus alba x Populus x berolinensis]|uniref:Uncharacterized protein n=1 Tax=Populus alba x Populus x berolinensis TaxID=444605 RepID=A0AAD6QER9_9ROSI|nr:hypothetical protein NC653_021673 [Populus alba x Populus x berolinensis]